MNTPTIEVSVIHLVFRVMTLALSTRNITHVQHLSVGIDISEIFHSQSDIFEFRLGSDTTSTVCDCLLREAPLPLDCVSKVDVRVCVCL